MNGEKIINFIPFGKENAISRHRLATLVGCSDRKMRTFINQARKKNVIINSQDGRGYYRPTIKDVAAVRKFKKQEENRAKEIFKCIQPVREFLLRAESYTEGD